MKKAGKATNITLTFGVETTKLTNEVLKAAQALGPIHVTTVLGGNPAIKRNVSNYVTRSNAQALKALGRLERDLAERGRKMIERQKNKDQNRALNDKRNQKAYKRRVSWLKRARALYVNEISIRFDRVVAEVHKRRVVAQNLRRHKLMSELDVFEIQLRARHYHLGSRLFDTFSFLPDEPREYKAVRQLLEAYYLYLGKAPIP